MDRIFPAIHVSAMTKTMIEHLKERLEVQLVKHGKKASPFAVEIGLKSDVIRDIIRKDAMPSADRLAVIADGLGVSIDYLLGRTDSPASTTQGKITSEPEILALLSRIDKLSPTDIDTAFGVIMLALRAKQGGSEPDESRDQSALSSSRREPVPSR